MKKTILLGMIASQLTLPIATAGSQTGSLRQQLVSDIQNGRLDRFSFIEAAFILSDVNSADSLQYYIDWYDSLVTRIKAFPFSPVDRVGSSKKLFNYIRATVYDEYQENSTTLLDIVHRKKYNCVSATILYNAISEDLGWPAYAFETPTHVYTIFDELGRTVIVENTHAMGFDIMQNLDAYSRYLLEFYPQSEALQIGLDRIYLHENSNGREINNLELLGLLAYNQAYFARGQKQYERAYDWVLMAQDFNGDSRSNVNFEIGLYYEWGKQCFDARRFGTAFQVFADAFYRYPDNNDFKRNSVSAFLNAMLNNWRQKDWRSSDRLIQEIMALDVLDGEGKKKLSELLDNWIRFFRQRRQNKLGDLATKYREGLASPN